MATSGMVDEQLKRIDDARRGLEAQALKIIAEIQDTILDYNREGQLYKGLDATGQKISPKYSRERYKRAKNRVNPLPGIGTPDLKLTGKFYSDFFLTAKNGVIDIFSSDEKADKLEAKYGDIFGLTTDNEGKMNEQILERLLDWVLMKI